MTKYSENPWINALLNAVVAFITALAVASCTVAVV